MYNIRVRTKDMVCLLLNRNRKEASNTKCISKCFINHFEIHLVNADTKFLSLIMICNRYNKLKEELLA
jgi:hypothetical protein